MLTRILESKGQIESLISQKMDYCIIAGLLGISKRCLQARIKNLGINGARSVKLFNEDFFEIINTEEKAYWLGFMAADGCVSTSKIRSVPRKVISISCAVKDKDHLLKFAKALDSKKRHVLSERRHKLHSRGYYQYLHLAFYSTKMYNDLINKGIVERKSLILEPPKNVPNNLIRHWIRGYFDGDGCVMIIKGSNRLKVVFIGTFEVLNFIEQIMTNEGLISKPKGRNIYRYSINRQDRLLKFYYYIYDDSSVFMERKKNIFLEKYKI